MKYGAWLKKITSCILQQDKSWKNLSCQISEFGVCYNNFLLHKNERNIKQCETVWKTLDFIIRKSIKNGRCIIQEMKRWYHCRTYNSMTNCIWPTFCNIIISDISRCVSFGYKRSLHNLSFYTSILNIIVFNLTAIIVIITDWNACNRWINAIHTSDLLQIANYNWMWIEYLAALFTIFRVLLDYAIMKVPWNPIEIAEIR